MHNSSRIQTGFEVDFCRCVHHIGIGKRKQRERGAQAEHPRVAAIVRARIAGIVPGAADHKDVAGVGKSHSASKFIAGRFACNGRAALNPSAAVPSKQPYLTGIRTRCIISMLSDC